MTTSSKVVSLTPVEDEGDAASIARVLRLALEDRNELDSIIVLGRAGDIMYVYHSEGMEDPELVWNLMDAIDTVRNPIDSD